MAIPYDCTMVAPTCCISPVDVDVDALNDAFARTPALQAWHLRAQLHPTLNRIQVLHRNDVATIQVKEALRKHLGDAYASIHTVKPAIVAAAPSSRPVPLLRIGRLYRCIMLGDAGVGKTSLLCRLCGDVVVNVRPTISVDLRVVYHVGNQFQLWDTAGQERYHSVIHSYYHDVHCAFILCDLTDPSTLQNVPYWMDQVRQYAPLDAHVVLVGNKSDLRKDRRVSLADLGNAAEDCGIPHCREVSAEDPEAVARLFESTFNHLIRAHNGGSTVSPLQNEKPAAKHDTAWCCA